MAFSGTNQLPLRNKNSKNLHDPMIPNVTLPILQQFHGKQKYFFPNTALAHLLQHKKTHTRSP
jgi:hypothetical protein